MFEKILVPLDGSKHSIKALEVAIQIALKFNGKITLIHVYSTGGFSFSATPLREFIEALHKAGVDILADGEKRAKAEGVDVETVLLEGHVVGQIIKVCKESKFDLIVMGARGLGKIEELVLGSVSDGVTRHACCPVLVVK
jgi:nucleotide-binding universal stress UspA family protein